MYNVHPVTYESFHSDFRASSTYIEPKYYTNTFLDYMWVYRLEDYLLVMQQYQRYIEGNPDGYHLFIIILTCEYQK